MNEQSAPPPSGGPTAGPTGGPTGGPTAGQTRTTEPPPPSQQSGPRVSSEQMRDVGRLRRSGNDRYIAGVAGGLGRHFDIDPTIIRVVLAVLTFFGGAGLLVYAAVWLFVPEDGHERAPFEVSVDARRILLVVTGVIALFIVFGSPFFGGGWDRGFPISLLVIGLVVVAVLATRGQRRPDRNQPPAPWGSTPTTSYSPEGSTMTSTTDTSIDVGQQPPAWMPPQPPPYIPPPRPRRTGLVLFWPTLALIAIALGTLGIFDTSSAVTVSAYGALAVVITAVMLLVGAFVGRPGGLIALGLVATLGLGITSAVDGATGGNTSGETLRACPTSSALVQDDYRIPNGDLTLDLTGVSDLAALDGREIDLHLYAGAVEVLLPRGLNAVVSANVGFAGDISIVGEHREGFDPTMTRTVTGSTDPNAPTIELDIDIRVGEITVEQP